MTSPSISVVIPAYNAEPFLAAALASVFAQTLQPAETFVVDDGSTDGTASIARRFAGVRLVQQENRGLPAARNAGIRLAGGDWIALLDADDLWEPGRLERQVVFAAQRGLAFVTARHRNMVDPGTVIPPELQRVLDSDLPAGGLPSSWLLHKDVFHRVGLFNEDQRVFEDMEWLTRAHEAGVNEVMVPEELVVRRFHGANLTMSHAREARENIMRLLRESLHRRRSNASNADEVP